MSFLHDLALIAGYLWLAFLAAVALLLVLDLCLGLIQGRWHR